MKKGAAKKLLLFSSHYFEQEPTLAIIPKPLHEHINSAFPANVCLVATVLPSGFAQVSRLGRSRSRAC